VNFYFENGQGYFGQRSARRRAYGTGRKPPGETPMTIARWPAGKTTFRFENTGFETTKRNRDLADQRNGSSDAFVGHHQWGIRVQCGTGGSNRSSIRPGKKLAARVRASRFRVTMAPGTYSFGARVEGLNEVAAMPLKVEKREIKSTHSFSTMARCCSTACRRARRFRWTQDAGVTPLHSFKNRNKDQLSDCSAGLFASTNEVVLQSGDRNKSVSRGWRRSP